MASTSLAGVFFGWHRREEAIGTPKRHATHATYAIPCNGAPGRCRRHRFFRGKKRHAAAVDRADPLPRPRAGGCEPFNCETPGATRSYATLHAVYNPVVTLLGISGGLESTS